MKKDLRLIAAGALLAAGIPLSASAQTISITATVNSQCNMGNATVAFGAITLNTLQTNTSQTFNLTCNKGATPYVALDNGLNASGTQKRLQGPAVLPPATPDFMNYNISVPDPDGVTCPSLPGGAEWNGTNKFNATTLFAASGGVRPLRLCVYIPTAQGFNFGAGAYTDTVIASVAFVP